MILHHGRIWVGSDSSIQQKIIEAFHASAVGGHSGFPATYRRIKQLFGLKNSVQQFVASCSTCQQAKPDRSRYPGLLQPLFVPTMAWQSISMDFVEVCLILGARIAFWWLLIVFPNMVILYHLLIHSRLLLSPSCSFRTFTVSMACPLQSYLIETKFSQISCGKNFSI